MKEFLLLKHLLKHEHDLSFKNIFGIRTVVTSGFKQRELYLLPNYYNAFQMYIKRVVILFKNSRLWYLRGSCSSFCSI